MKLLVLLLFWVELFAHSISIHSHMHDNMLEIEASYPDGTPCKGCTLYLKDINGTLLLKDTLDNDGSISTPLLKHIETVEIDAGLGHRASEKLHSHTHSDDTLDIGKIACGVGYILGIFGIIMLFKRRK